MIKPLCNYSNNSNFSIGIKNGIWNTLKETKTLKQAHVDNLYQQFFKRD